MKSLIFLFFIAFVNCEELISLFVVHRHGDRTPVSAYVNDPYNKDEVWQDGWGELTMEGKYRMFNVGKFIKERYSNFLTNNVREAEIRSSTRERCLESTQLVLNGVYPPKDRWIWEKNQFWQPFPIATTFKEEDSMLNPSSSCFEADHETRKIFDSKYVKELDKKFSDIYDLLTEKCGEPVQNIVKASYIYDCLKIEKYFNLILPSWATDDLMTKLEEINRLSFSIMSFTKKLQVLRTGVFLEDLANKIKIRSKKDSKNETYDHPDYENLRRKKFSVYSTHDTFVTFILQALDVFDGKVPQFGATVLFELNRHSNDTSDWKESHSIKLFYLNDTFSKKPVLLKIPACKNDDICTVKKFLAAIDYMRLNPDQWIEKCNKRKYRASISDDMTFSDDNDDIVNLIRMHH